MQETIQLHHELAEVDSEFLQTLESATERFDALRDELGAKH